MFEPDCMNVICPKCQNVGIYFDHEMGFYCMLCGRHFSSEEMQLLMEAERLRNVPHSVSTDPSDGV